MMIIAEVDSKTHDVMLEEGKVKIGWNKCRVINLIAILRCFKCCGYYHFARDFKKEVPCGQCAGKHTSRECKEPTKKCVNCEEKIKSFRIKNIDSGHLAFDAECPGYIRELDKQKNKVNGML